ncbi:MAG: glycosyl hydrolase [Candidatus Margulisiibacteriota bacterium]|nr:glycosyl hydrolase [Candidatus Margulisiibacteriota bacterium]
MSEPLMCKKITPAPNGGVYQGIFPGDNTPKSGKTADTFAAMSGTGVDIEANFIAFSTGLNFPTARAKTAAAKGRALFIKLEPFNPKKWKRLSKAKKRLYVIQKLTKLLNKYSLEDIVAGKFDQLLIKFAKGAKAFGKPVFVSFAHEMNSDWYPWAGNPALYIKAWRHVHAVMKKAGACNITWVWNPDVSSRPDKYYPGRKYVDWVAPDGYNWTGTYKASDIFDGTLQYLKTLGHPMMIGEFGCAKNNTACLTDFVNYATNPKNKIKGYVYFNMNKEEKWGIKTKLEKSAYKAALSKYTSLFSSNIRSGKITLAPITTHKETRFLPYGFTRPHILSPGGLIEENSKKIKDSETRMRTNRAQHTRKMDRINAGIAFMHEYFKVQIYTAAIFGEHIIQWMLHRENGNPKSYLLSRSLNYKIRSPYWRTKVALLIVSGSPDRKQIRHIQKLGFGRGLKLTPPLTRNQRHKLLFQILAKYPKKAQTRIQRAEGVDALLRAEIMVQLALTAPDKAATKKYFKLADDAISALQTNLKDIFDQLRTKRKFMKIRNPFFLAIKKRFLFGKERGVPVQDQIVSEILFSRGQVRMLRAQILQYQAGRLNKQTEVFKKLQKAYKMLQASVPYLQGIHYQQVKRMAAACLIQMGFIAKDLEGTNILKLGTDKVFRQLRKWELEVYGRNKVGKRSYTAFFRAAKVLTRGLPNESVLNWIAAYNKQVPKPSNQSAWLKQINAYTRIWLAKLELVNLQEQRKGHPNQYLKIQKQKIKIIERMLRIVAKIGIDPDILSDVLTALSEALAQQAFITLNLGSRTASAKFLTSAKAYLIKALKNASPQTRADINLWLAKILYIEAGNSDTTQARRRILVIAQKHISKALGPDILRGPQLSYALQTQGEIYLLQKKLSKALVEINKAINIFPQNYGARAIRADIYSQQGHHQLAIDKYNALLAAIRKSFPHPDLKARIKLGIAEAKMRKGENYSNKNVAALELAVPDVLNNQAVGSFLITRAISALIEAYGTNEDWHDKIIFITKYLLGQKVENGSLPKALKDSLTKIKDVANVYPRFRAILYLKLAETLIWRKKFAEASKVSNGDGIPKALLDQVIKKDSELYPAYLLVKAELTMRKTRTSGSVMKLSLQRAIFQARQEDLDPNLYTRLILDQMEGLSYEKRFKKMVELGLKYQKYHLGKIKKLFTLKGRPISFLKFKYKLWLKIANAYSWLAGKLGRKGKAAQSTKFYRLSLRELTRILKATKNIPDTLPYGDLKKIFQGQVYVSRGDIYLADWKNPKFQPSKGKAWKTEKYDLSEKWYNQARTTLEGLTEYSKDAKIAMTSTFFGLGELYRFAKGKRDYQLSKTNYEKAEGWALKLPVLNEDRDVLMTKLNFGLAKLEQQEGNNSLAWVRLSKALKLYKRILVPPEELKGPLLRMKQDVYEPHITTGFEMFNDVSAIETRLGITLRLPVWRDQLTLYAQNFTDHRTDIRGRSTVNNTYLGLKLKPDFLKKRVTLDFKWKALIPKYLPLRSGGSENAAAVKPLYFRRPDIGLSLSYWGKYFTAAYSWNKNIENKLLDTHYLSIMGNIGATKNPFAQIKVGLILNLYNFVFLNNTGNEETRNRRSLALGLNYELDLAELLKPRISHNLLKIRAFVNIPIYEREYNPAQGITTHRTIGTGPWQWGLGLEYNMGKYGRIQLTGNVSHQNTTTFKYWSWGLGFNWLLRF